MTDAPAPPGTDPLVDCVIEDDRWSAADLPALAERAARAALAAIDLAPGGFQIVVMGCDDARIATLNADFRGKPKPTNVLSWPSEDLAEEPEGTPPARPLPGDDDEPWSLGDIAIAWDTCQREAAEQGKAFADHVTHLLIHGVLHLLGHDHVRDADATLMEGIEVRALATLAISDPY